MDLILKNNLSKVEYTFENVSVSEKSLYYNVLFEMKDLYEGEYTYQLLDNDKNVIATGLLHYGDYTPEENKTYSNERKYKQYGK